MGSRFIRVTIIKANPGSSVVGFSAYLSRSAQTDLHGKRFDFSHKRSELVDHGLILPAGAPEWAKDPEALWRAAELAEMTLDRKSKEWRAKVNAQLAKHITIALPLELSDAGRRQLLLDFIETELCPQKFGVAVEWAIHRDEQNPHAHLLVSTRTLGPEGFGKKAREMNPDFATRKRAGADGSLQYRRFVSEEEEWDTRWASFQQRWCRHHGIDLEIRPRAEIPEPHLEERDMRKHKALKELITIRAANKAVDAAKALNPRDILDRLTERRAIFTGKDLRRHFRLSKIAGEEADALGAAVTSHPDVIMLQDERGQRIGWTTRQVRAQEQGIIEAAAAMLRRNDASANPFTTAEQFYEARLTHEQRWAGEKLAGASRLALLIGRAGTGKTYLLHTIRRTYEKDGWRVIGLSPTNTVAQDLKKEGFALGQTLHTHLKAVESGRESWNEKTLVIVDEAAMADTEIMARLFRAARASGAKLILAGDDKQFESVLRGGIFTELVRRHGAPELREVLRQKVDWQARASQSYAAGNVRAALEAYDARGQIIWTQTLAEAQARAAEECRAPPGQRAFLYASTNAAVDGLNQAAQQRWRREQAALSGRVIEGLKFQTVRGEISLAPGERIQFHATDKGAGIITSEFGMAKEVSAGRIVVTRQDGSEVTFDPRKFDGWSLGWAATSYKGQGKSLPRTHAVYDHPYAFDLRAAYVTGTRHRHDMRIYVPREFAKDMDALVDQIERQREDRSASVRYKEHVPPPPQPVLKPQVQPQPKERPWEARPVPQAGAQRQQSQPGQAGSPAQGPQAPPQDRRPEAGQRPTQPQQPWSFQQAQRPQEPSSQQKPRSQDQPPVQPQGAAAPPPQPQSQQPKKPTTGKKMDVKPPIWTPGAGI
jgi:Ti-type conjugative transfer relaxase TraA